MTETRDMILEHAVDLTTTVGFDSFSYADLAQRVDIAKASIHHHFPKKEDLGLALCVLAKLKMDEAFKVIKTSSTSPLKQLESYFKQARKMSDGCQRVCLITSLQASVQVISDTMRQNVKDIADLEVAFMASILKEGKKAGEMSFEGDAEAQAAMICATLKGALQYARIHGQASFDSIIRQVRRSLQLRPKREARTET